MSFSEKSGIINSKNSDEIDLGKTSSLYKILLEIEITKI